jgi:hypothetical protein
MRGRKLFDLGRKYFDYSYSVRTDIGHLNDVNDNVMLPEEPAFKMEDFN